MFVETLIAAVAVGMLIGFGLFYVLVADPLRRSCESLRNRIIAEQMRTYAAQSRLAAHRMLARPADDRWSRKAPDLKAVK